MVVAALDADQRGGTAVFVPPGAMVGAPGEADQRIDEIAREAGPAGVAQAFESFIGAPVTASPRPRPYTLPLRGKGGALSRAPGRARGPLAGF